MDFGRLDKRITTWMERHGHRWLRWSLGIIFIWFGILKPFWLSPANGLIAATVYWLPPELFIPFLGVWEVIIGICLLHRPWIRAGLILMTLQMVGTFLPLVLLPDVAWSGFLVPTLEGQYIIKNLVLITAAIVIGGTVRHRHPKVEE